MKYPVYPEMKDSGIEFIGDIPKHWEVSKLKYKTIVNMGQSPSSEYYNDSGIGYPFLQGNAEFEERNPVPKVFCDKTNKFANKDDILISVRAPVGEINIADQKYGIGRGLCALSVKTINNLFLWYDIQVLRKELFSLSTGSTYDSVSSEDIRNLTIIIPTSEEQKAIANFLDKETGRIDQLIEKKEQLISLLEEKRQATISHVVTKGLNSDVPMKKSGIKWLGKIPEHWRILNLRYATRNMIAGPFGSSLTKDMYTKEGYKVYGQEQVIPDDFTIGDYYVSTKKYKEMKRYQVRSGDILVSCVGTFGRVSVVPDNIEPGIINPRLIKIESKEKVNPYFFKVLLRSKFAFNQFDRLSRGGTIGVINIGLISNLKILLPPKDEQQQIADYLDKETKKIDKLIEKIKQQISNLKEYRQALISNTVTGKIDVREVYQDE